LNVLLALALCSCTNYLWSPPIKRTTHERLADAMPISDLVMVPRKRAAGKGVGKSVGTLSDTDGETQAKTGAFRQTPEIQTVD